MSVTPLRQQYLQVKQRYPGALLLFRLGDFYETFDDDARIAARVLGITLTSREMGKDNRVPMAGIPYHALESYLGRLIAAGHKVAICEQTSDPAEGKGLVDREVIRVVTPGTVIETGLLDQKANNYLAALVIEDSEAGIAHVDITTGEFATTQLPADQALAELERLVPAELLHPKDAELPAGPGGSRTALDTRLFDLEAATERLQRHFGVSTLEGYGCAGLPLAVRAAGAILAYLAETQAKSLGQISSLATYSTGSFMALDPQTRRNLELTQGGRWGAAEHSLLRVLDGAKSAMGGRLLRRWLSQPLLDCAVIGGRLDAVQWFHERPLVRSKAQALIARIADLERLCGRIGSGVAVPRELVALRHGLEQAPVLRAMLEEENASALGPILETLKPCHETVALLRTAITDDPPAALADGEVIRPGFNAELDELRSASSNAKGYLVGLEKTERERTGIKSLKVGYNRVFGYYIELSKANLAQAPADYIRKQTLANAERFITPQLKEYESLILTAQERIAALEAALFRQVCQQVAEAAPAILATAGALALVDVYAGLAEVAARHHYTRPVLTDGDGIEIVAGRHPIVERNVPLGAFVPNDTSLSNAEAQLVILTGPNMAGKSTYLRQVGLIVFMAQTGSFVPADSVRLGIVDRIFTRVGLQDDLATGQSTFMVEMVETAHILNNATPRSLIILDEIGRGTSTYDGLAIARAVAEHIHNHPRLGAKTLFATHYHELTDLARYLPRVRNAHVAVAEEEGRIVFLHKIVPGGADRSYGVHVAQLAGLPRPVIGRAQEVLESLERDGGRHRPRPAARRGPSPTDAQLALFGQRPEVLNELLKLDVASMSPLEAITKLFELQEKAKREGA